MPAFTLIELIAGVAIIGILVVLAVGAAQKALRRAKDQQCLAHLHELARASLIYTAENNGLLPKTYLYNTGNPTNSYFFDVISPYLDAPVKSNGQAVGLSEIFRCPRSPAWASGVKPRLWANMGYITVAIPPYDSPRLANIRPSSTVALLDCREPSMAYGLTDAAQFQKFVPELPPHQPWRHDQGINAVYWDGHAAFIPNPAYKDFKPDLD